jgi:Rrf2 family protein
LKFNTRIRYGIRAILEIALEESEKGVFQKDISERQNISVKYLDSIISSLKTAGLIINLKGKKSGYKLTRKPSEIHILDIYRAFEPGINIVECISGNYSCNLSDTCGVRNFWKGLNTSITEYFYSFTLEDLIKEHKSKEAALNPGQI